MKKVIAVFVLATLIVGGAWYWHTRPTALTLTPEQAAFWSELTEDCGEDLTYFMKYGALSGYKGDVVALLLSGFESENPVVRWFAAYNSIDYMGTPFQARLDKGLRKLNDDPIEDVKQAVRFALSFYDGNYKFHPWVEASPDNTFFVYHRYHSAQYNDSKIWQVRNSAISLLQEVDGSVWDMFFSLDGGYLAVTHGGYNWGSTALINANTGAVTDILPWSYLEERGIEVFGSHSRPDPYVVFREWSANSQQILFYYGYTTPGYARMYGHGVYDLEVGKVIRATLPILQTEEIILDRTELGWD